jgi:hypothetical protein
MNTPTIEMPREVAREQLRHYRSQLHKRADAEYQAVATGLEHLARGTRLLNLADCFKNVPLDQHYRPKLAIARADRKTVRFRRESRSVGRFDTRPPSHRGGRPWPKHGLTFDLDLPLSPADVNYWNLMDGSSVVPMIPASVREAIGRIDLAKHFVLWEVTWADTPRDPYLLKWTGAGDLYAVLAEWDLTDLERAVMGGRASS